VLRRPIEAAIDSGKESYSLSFRHSRKSRLTRAISCRPLTASAPAGTDATFSLSRHAGWGHLTSTLLDMPLCFALKAELADKKLLDVQTKI
jgi:hypothetical protein